MPDEWAPLTETFLGAYDSVKGYVRTTVLHDQLHRHLPGPPASILDVGGGAATQSLPLAREGYDVTVLDRSAAMLAAAQERLGREPTEVRQRVRLVEGPGEDAAAATDGATYAAVLCHGVLGYLDRPEPLVSALCERAEPGGLVSIMTGNANASAVRPALEGRWADALAGFDCATEVGVLGVTARGDTVDHLSGLLRDHGVEPQARYGVWLFCDWLDLPLETTDVAAVAKVELEASLRDPYRGLSRVFHLVGRRPDPAATRG